MKAVLLLCLALLALPTAAKIAVWGDTQAHPRVQTALATAMAAQIPDLVIHTGDLSHKGDQAAYTRFFELSAPLAGIPLLAVRGNHDGSAELFSANLGRINSWYSSVHDSLLIICLDSNLSLLPGSPQYAWLLEQLRSPLPRILVLHHPPFSSGYHGGDQDLQLFLPALCAKHSVSAVLSGHDHHYERLSHGETTYLVSGGGGGIKRPSFKRRDPRSQVLKLKFHFLLLERQGQSLLLSAHDLRGKVFDQSVIPLLTPTLP
ncbi:MAG: metallophosphoesterase [Candidatus Cloacimonetes bacterium]|jgi:predicted phosphodiesterase|nr:metallophosphoesterase [Candidatus Cloacimonadota bacterium]MDD3143093.1 metallophosphoesterase [Candidatus Cloacimonadota bacterium]MDY0367132.1 metallophosphoesterase [Candidatus Syntrophosphaera sp.]